MHVNRKQCVNEDSIVWHFWPKIFVVECATSQKRLLTSCKLPQKKGTLFNIIYFTTACWLQATCKLVQKGERFSVSFKISLSFLAYITFHKSCHMLFRKLIPPFDTCTAKCMLTRLWRMLLNSYESRKFYYSCNCEKGLG